MTMKQKTENINTYKNKALMLLAMKIEYGNVTASCKLACVSKAQHYRWMNKDDTYNAQITDIKEKVIDYVESGLIKNIIKGKERSIIFYLNTWGKSRGYGKVNHTSTQDENKIHQELSKKSDEEIDMLLKEIQKNKKNSSANNI